MSRSFKVKLYARVMIPVTAEITVEANSEEAVIENIQAILDDRHKKWQEDYAAWLASDHKGRLPQQVSWETDSDDIYNNVEHDTAVVDHIEEVI